MSRSGLIVFQKNATLGKVKTRLAATVGDQEAMKIYQWLTSHTHRILGELEVDKFLFFSDYIPELEIKNFPNYRFEVQVGTDLGQRMSQAFSRLFEIGFEKVIIIGTDCAELTSQDLKNAFSMLDSHDLVLGPAKDGGYYLLGTRRNYPELFREIPWSTEKVLELTRIKANELNLKHGLLNALSDIDTAEDWQNFITKNPIIHE
ncbi:glycosyltransferase [Algoriphagus lacus]|uniref:Glycosyltransferase n=1 Tax=Algoriphagus lacus TaxID=2056311 RepID=A0A418PSG3_9BACT|nr:TIGR04282 family arsenosugar biosynthesis glycosyltransferase [Algoriphagus lacus]RIW15833.1 glycosyltransferase [Algoriphagus lacus]